MHAACIFSSWGLGSTPCAVIRCCTVLFYCQQLSIKYVIRDVQICMTCFSALHCRVFTTPKMCIPFAHVPNKQHNRVMWRPVRMCALASIKRLTYNAVLYMQQLVRCLSCAWKYTVKMEHFVSILYSQLCITTLTKKWKHLLLYIWYIWLTRLSITLPLATCFILLAGCVELWCCAHPVSNYMLQAQKQPPIAVHSMKLEPTCSW